MTYSNLFCLFFHDWVFCVNVTLCWSGIEGIDSCLRLELIIVSEFSNFVEFLKLSGCLLKIIRIFDIQDKNLVPKVFQTSVLIRTKPADVQIITTTFHQSLHTQKLVEISRADVQKKLFIFIIVLNKIPSYSRSIIEFYFV